MTSRSEHRENSAQIVALKALQALLALFSPPQSSSFNFPHVTDSEINISELQVHPIIDGIGLNWQQFFFLKI